MFQHSSVSSHHWLSTTGYVLGEQLTATAPDSDDPDRHRTFTMTIEQQRRNFKNVGKQPKKVLATKESRKRKTDQNENDKNEEKNNIEPQSEQEPKISARRSKRSKTVQKNESNHQNTNKKQSNQTIERRNKQQSKKQVNDNDERVQNSYSDPTLESVSDDKQQNQY